MIGIILTIAILGLVVYLVTTFIPMPPPFKTVIYVIAVVLLLLYVLSAFGALDTISVPRVHRVGP
jgi:predicted membrane channel-forming protein YqfA (hemolysin III family)